MAKHTKIIISILLFFYAGFFCLGKNCWATTMDVIINEVMPFPAQNNYYNEWIEIYNSGSENIDLSNYTLCDKKLIAGYIDHQDEQIKLENGIILGNDQYAIITDGKTGTDVYSNFQINSNALALHVDAGSLCSGVLTNSGKSITLEVDSSVYNFTYPKAEEEKSFSLIDENIHITNPTPGAINEIAAPKLESKEEDVNENNDVEEQPSENIIDGTNTIPAQNIIINKLGDVVINEFVSDPADEEVEWIEFYNTTSSKINLDNWTIEDNTKKPKILNNLIIEARGYLILNKGEEFTFSLNNGGDIIILRDDAKNLIDQVAYGNWDGGNIEYNAPLAKDPYSVARKSDGYNNYNNFNDFDVTTTVTKNRSNIITTEQNKKNNQTKITSPLPAIDFDCPEKSLTGIPILFNSSNTFNKDNELKFYWNFGDNFTNILKTPEHTFFNAGIYTIKFIIDDGKNRIEKEKIINIVNNLDDSKPQNNIADADIVINEFLPNPEGDDAENEFIELYNQGDSKVNLINWKVDDSEGGSKPYIFNVDFQLDSGMYYLLNRDESKIVLNNATDAVRLFNNFNELVEEIEYENVIEGASYSKGRNNKWFWTKKLTPKKENIISVAGNYDQEIIVKSANYDYNDENIAKINGVELEDINQCEIGDIIQTAGIVAVEPGILGSQYFYIVASSSDNRAGIQVYNYKKDFPVLNIGDYIEIQGEISKSNEELRIKTKTQNDFKIVSHKNPLIAEIMDCEEINDDHIGQLISVAGEVIERKSSIIYLDDGTDEVIVYIKKFTNINPKSIKEGDEMQITGIVGRTKSGIRIMPRSNDDIIKKVAKRQNIEVNNVLGEVAINDVWELTQRNKKLELFKYLLVISSGTIIALIGLLIKKR